MINRNWNYKTDASKSLVLGSTLSDFGIRKSILQAQRLFEQKRNFDEKQLIDEFWNGSWREQNKTFTEHLPNVLSLPASAP